MTRIFSRPKVFASHPRGIWLWSSWKWGYQVRMQVEWPRQWKIVSSSMGGTTCEKKHYRRETQMSQQRKFTTKDSGKREEFASGAVRDVQADKPRYDLIPPKGLRRVADLYARGAVKYEEMNWRKGMPSSRIMASLLRHVEAYRAGDRTE